MGRGAARIFGIDLPENFLSPFLARGPMEFWKRWHITLSEWIRDYLFIPLWMRHQSWLGGGFVLLLTMLFAGLWHGAEWTFALYGFYWGSLILLEHLWRKSALYRKGYLRFPVWVRWGSALALMFPLTVLSRLLFRAGSLERLGSYLDALISHPGSYGSAQLSLVGILIGTTFFMQVAGWRSLEPGSRPLWRRLYDQTVGRSFEGRRWSPLEVGAAGAALGIALAVAFVGSVSLSLSSSPSRPFIYWSVPAPR
jgi:hypothetical protein